MKEINETHYVITLENGEVIETTSRKEARKAVGEKREVTKNTRKIFKSGASTVRLYISTDITDVKNL